MGFEDHLDDRALLDALQHWDLGPHPAIATLSGGLNSRVWRVTASNGDFVAKLTRDSDPFEAGLLIAEQLEHRGFSAGEPRRRRDGSLVLPLAQGTLGLIRFVPGEPLTGPGKMRTWGTVMARLHRAMAELPRVPPSLTKWPWPWLDPSSSIVAARPWLGEALSLVAGRARAVAQSRSLTAGVLHGDGAPVTVDQTSGRMSVLDWGAAMWGPLLYDIASAYWFAVVEPGLDPATFEPFVAAYREAGPLGDQEWRSLPLFVRLRAVVQAFYFAWRCDNDVLIGLTREQNLAKLDEARHWLEASLASAGQPQPDGPLPPSRPASDRFCIL
jgi:Ser/Thr protein kinase RdoA (MazF antagonist)